MSEARLTSASSAARASELMLLSCASRSRAREDFLADFSCARSSVLATSERAACKARPPTLTSWCASSRLLSARVRRRRSTPKAPEPGSSFSITSGDSSELRCCCEEDASVPTEASRLARFADASLAASTGSTSLLSSCSRMPMCRAAVDPTCDTLRRSSSNRRPSVTPAASLAAITRAASAAALPASSRSLSNLCSKSCTCALVLEVAAAASRLNRSSSSEASRLATSSWRCSSSARASLAVTRVSAAAATSCASCCTADSCCMSSASRLAAEAFTSAERCSKRASSSAQAALASCNFTVRLPILASRSRSCSSLCAVRFSAAWRCCAKRLSSSAIERLAAWPAASASVLKSCICLSVAFRSCCIPEACSRNCSSCSANS
mmetsp:Transcript_14367/g.39415  ORF Transcript_14367/g.39415 Transcript_14367/m.39415 type:complete len:381 (-) Transcript_14367:1016-2158(-)